MIPETKTIDLQTWNALIFISTSLITVLLSLIAWYMKRSADSQDKVVVQVTTIATDMAVVKVNGENMKENVEQIKDDVDEIRKEIRAHDNRISKLEILAK